MNLRKNQQGFTIVELLIVVVVIAILAAISIVAYTGITARANNSTAAATAKAVKDVATNHQGANGAFPQTRTAFVQGGGDPIAKMPSDIIFIAAGVTGPATANSVMQHADRTAKEVVVLPCGGGGTPATATGYRIYYKNFTSGVTTANFVDAGDCTTAPTGTSVTPVPAS